jgi:hypothetical protein
MPTLFENIVRKSFILKEDAQIDRISGAVTGMHPIILKYDDKQGGGGKNKRVVYPVAYGISTAGNPVIRAFQKQGSTKTSSPKWKLFRLDRVSSMRVVTSRTFNPQELVGFRSDGDEQMTTLYCISPIGKAKSGEYSGNYVKLKATPITKDDIEAEKSPKAAASVQAKAAGQRQSAEDVVNDIVNNIDNNQEGQNIDNTSTSGYNNEKWQQYKMNATDSDPIYKNEIPGGDNQVGTGDGSTIDKTQIGDGPISKEDLTGNGEEENKEENPATDLLKRMDNLNQDENS